MKFTGNVHLCVALHLPVLIWGPFKPKSPFTTPVSWYILIIGFDPINIREEG